MSKTPAEFIDWLNEAMEQQGWSMRETSLRAGLSDGRVGQIMRGESPPGHDAAEKLARLFHVDTRYVKYLAGLEDYDPTEAMEPEVQAIADRLATLPKGQIRDRLFNAIIAMIDVALTEKALEDTNHSEEGTAA